MMVLGVQVLDEVMRGLWMLSSLGWGQLAVETALIGLVAVFVVAAWRLRADRPVRGALRRERSCP